MSRPEIHRFTAAKVIRAAKSRFDGLYWRRLRGNRGQASCHYLLAGRRRRAAERLRRLEVQGLAVEHSGRSGLDLLIPCPLLKQFSAGAESLHRHGRA